MNTSLGSINVANESSRRVIGIACAGALLILAYSVAFAQQEQEQAPPISAGELDSLVAPIALYPDTLLAQTLAASTYPLEVMQLDQWMKKNTNLKDKALADAVAKQPWDPSVQAMAAFPDVVTRMAENIQWMTDIGNAFLEQQKDVMDAVQRMRVKAQGTGNLKTGSEQKVETKTTASGQQAVVIEQANPEKVYVPSYDPQVVYGAPPAEYPYYPYSYPGYQPGTALAWGTGIALGATWANNNWGNCDWDDANVTINNNNNFNKNSINNVNKGTGNGWQHNPQHRGNAPYANKQTANKYGGTARGESRAGGTGAPGGAGARPGTSGAGPGGANVKAGDRAAGGGAQARDAGERAGGGGGKASGGGAKTSGGGAGNREAGGGSSKAAKGGGGGNNVGNRTVSSGSSGNAFGGGAGSKGSSAKAASNRGGGSMKGGGGGGRGGGGKGGGGRKR
jgi:hypothetical protein